ncbi:DegT/DnrJ/EryC1/StrS family aminotransferase [Candidatus Poribacteria bacterium]|nr:DegT/DnrJ/EryC1/StrS family aminotransferase [Candidatus Poribacteria bacterium]
MAIQLVDLKAQYAIIKDEINEAIREVLESQYFILGPKVVELENKIAEYCNTKYGVSVASGSDAILIALMSIGVGIGDEVITTPFTFFATAGSVSRLGAKPVFVDIDSRTYNINPELISEKINSRTKAIIPVHLYGQCADMDPIIEIANKNNIWVIEDAAQAIGAKYKDKKAGSMGHLGCLSFFPTKNLGGYGDGGMIVTNDEALAEKVRVLRTHGSKPKYYHSMIGLNSRLDAIQAAVLLAKFKYLDQWNEARRHNAKIYDSLFNSSGIVTPHVEEFNYHIYNQYSIITKDRDKLRDMLNKAGISTEIYYPVPLHLQECYSDLGYKQGDLPISERVAKSILSLPIYPELTKEQQGEVVDNINKFKKVL